MSCVSAFRFGRARVQVVARVWERNREYSPGRAVCGHHQYSPASTEVNPPFLPRSDTSGSRRALYPCRAKTTARLKLRNAAMGALEGKGPRVIGICVPHSLRAHTGNCATHHDPYGCLPPMGFLRARRHPSLQRRRTFVLMPMMNDGGPWAHSACGVGAFLLSSHASLTSQNKTKKVGFLPALAIRLPPGRASSCVWRVRCSELRAPVRAPVPGGEGCYGESPVVVRTPGRGFCGARVPWGTYDGRALVGLSWRARPELACLLWSARSRVRARLNGKARSLSHYV